MLYWWYICQIYSPAFVWDDVMTRVLIHGYEVYVNF